MVSFRWYGQACFQIKDSVTVVTDPHDGDSVGLKAPEIKGDLITISHEHYDHASGKDMVSRRDTKIVSGEGTQEVKGIRVTGFHSYHDKVEGDARGENVIYKFELDEFKICHLGDLGHRLSEEKIQRIKPIDILLIPVGGKFTIDGIEASGIVKELEPQVAIPMHFKIEGLEVPISGPGQFLEQIKGEYEVEEREELELEELPRSKKVIKLECQS